VWGAPGAGMDRGRAGERLRAALAGLQELRFLRDKQRDMVTWALRLDLAEPPTPFVQVAPGEITEEQRLEATLTALKQQLTRVRKQDVGLKTHLQQLDQQINELKLDVCKVSTEHLESDSRPSSGFYELSDGGSGSLSNSCTSVYSECLSSSSQTNLLQPSACPAPKAESCRRRSADESAARADPPRSRGARLGGSRIRTSTTSAERARRRPVSTGENNFYCSLPVAVPVTTTHPLHGTGDLDHVTAPGPGCGGSALTYSLRNPVVDLRYQNDLVSRGGGEVYHYPSPLHAVALQSPIFSPCADAGGTRRPSVTEAAPAVARGAEEGATKGVGYIDKILQRSASKISVREDNGPDGPQVGFARRPPARGSGSGAVRSGSRVEPPGRPDAGRRASEQAAPQTTTAEVAALAEEVSGRSRETPKAPERKQKPACPSEELSAKPAFVRAQFVPAGSQHVKVGHADKKMKAAKLRRRSCDKPRGPKPPKPSSKERDLEPSSRMRGDRYPKHSNAGKHSGLSGLPTPPYASCGHQVSRSSKTYRPHHLVSDPTAIDPGRTNHLNPSEGWSSHPAAGSQKQRMKDVPVHGATRRSAVTRTVGARPKSGHWPFQPSNQSGYNPGPFLGAARCYPPRCESVLSEYSAECASLFHSTIVESSGDELSDYTTNRYGDSESSQDSQSHTDSDSSLSLDEEDLEDEEQEGGLVWAEAALGPTAAGLPLTRSARPAASTCRIKASRALKKKIRRFQPASLKVMTLV
uniref:Dishevelled binding antagonist of beta catenin 2 n=1 Tax=Denticeps clupeoides TaxID=299321 RepID=A0AAY4BIL8_9TELE